MPNYEYRCERCSNRFSVNMHMAEQGKGDVTCPSCGGPVLQEYSSFYAKTSKKS